MFARWNKLNALDTWYPNEVHEVKQTECSWYLISQWGSWGQTNWMLLIPDIPMRFMRSNKLNALDTWYPNEVHEVKQTECFWYLISQWGSWGQTNWMLLIPDIPMRFMRSNKLNAFDTWYTNEVHEVKQTECFWYLIFEWGSWGQTNWMFLIPDIRMRFMRSNKLNAFDTWYPNEVHEEHHNLLNGHASVAAVAGHQGVAVSVFLLAGTSAEEILF